jgi:hypothetical protein
MNILIHRNGEQYGPYGLEEVREHLRGGAISADDLAWADGMPDWRPLREILPSEEPRVTAIPLPAARSSAAVVTAARPSLGSAASVNPYQAVFDLRHRLYRRHDHGLRSRCGGGLAPRR